MAKDSKRRCLDCENIDANSLFDKGNGKCRECKGTGHDQHAEALVQFATLGQEGDYYPCKLCSGTGQCQTCGGTGYEYFYETKTSYETRNDSSDGETSNFWGKVIGFLIVAAIVIWFVFTIAIPLSIINIAIISLIVGLVKKKFNIILFSISILGAIYVVIDFNKHLFTKTLVNNFSFFDSLIPIFFYANIIAGLIAAYFLIRDLINKKNPSVKGEGEFSKRNLITMGCLLLLGILIIVFQKRYGVESTELIHSSVIENPSTISTTDQFIDNKIKDKVNEYLNRNTQPSVEYVSSLYANNVDFYNAGIVDKKFIFKDKIEYFSKWSSRQYTIISNVEVTPSSEARTWLASFDYYYQVKNTKRSRQGNAWCKLIFKEEGNSLVIVSEKGGLYKQ